MGELRRVGRDWSFSVAGRAGAALLALGSVLLASRMLGPTQYGSVALVMVGSSVAYALLASWNGPPVLVLGARELEQTGSFAETSVARLVIIGSASTLLILVGTVAWLGGFRPGGPIVSAVVLATVGYIVVEHVVLLLETAARYSAAALLALFRPALYLALLTGLAVAVGAPDTNAVLIAVSASWLFAALVALVIAITSLPAWPARLTRPALEKIWRRAAPLIPYSVASLVFGAIDLFLVALWRRPESVGHYALAYQAFAMGTTLALALVPVMTPRLSRSIPGGGMSVEDYVAAVNRRVLPGIALVGSAVTVLATPVMRFAFGGPYEAAIQPALVLVPAWVFQAGTAALIPMLLSRGQERLMGKVVVFAVVLNVVLDIVLLTTTETAIWGPALASSLASAVIWVAYAKHLGRTGLYVSRLVWWLVPTICAAAAAVLAG